MRVKITKQETTYTEMDIKFPLYACIETLEDSTYVKITKNEFIQIKIDVLNTEITNFKTDNNNDNTIIPFIWIENKCDKKQFQIGLNHVIARINSLKP